MKSKLNICVGYAHLNMTKKAVAETEFFAMSLSSLAILQFSQVIIGSSLHRCMNDHVNLLLN